MVDISQFPGQVRTCVCVCVCLELTEESISCEAVRRCVEQGLSPRMCSFRALAAQNSYRDQGSRKQARNHSAAEIAGFFASPAAKDR